MRLFHRPVIAILTATICSSAGAAQAPALPSLLERAGAYTRLYQERFAVVIGDEEYEQHVDGRSYRGARERNIVSETMFLWLRGERLWLSVRNVVTVDGHPIGNSRKRLDRLLSSTDTVGIAHLRWMRDEGARFNIGTIRRSFNDPMCPLQFLEPEQQWRFTFALTGDEPIAGIDTRRVAFDEQAKPTFIQNGNRAVPTHGILWLADDGSVLRTRLEVTDPLKGLRALVFVDYRPEPKLDMLVPTTMHETYMAAGANAERVECNARYSGFRRFETAARIVPDR